MIAHGWQDGSRLELDGRGRAGRRPPVLRHWSACGWRSPAGPRSASACIPGPAAGRVMSTAVRLVRDYAFDVPGLTTLRWRAKAGNWASRRVAAAAGFVFDGRCAGCWTSAASCVDGWVATMTRDDPRTPRRGLVPVELLGDGTGAAAVRRVRRRPDRRGLLRRADPALAGLACPGRTRVADALSYLEPPVSWPPGAPGWSGASPMPTTTAASARSAWRAWARYAPRAEIGYWAHPEARGRGAGHRGRPAGHRLRRVGRAGRLDHDPLRGRTTRPPGTSPRPPATARWACCRRRSRSATGRCPTWCCTPAVTRCREARSGLRCAKICRVTLRVSVIGTNYLGATHAAGMAEFGHHVDRRGHRCRIGSRR